MTETSNLELPSQALKADWRSAERDPYKRIPVLEAREEFTTDFRALAERLAMRHKFFTHFERQVRKNWDDNADRRYKAAKKLIYETCRQLKRGANKNSARLDWRTLHQQMDNACYSAGFADVALDAAYHNATHQLQRLDAAREAIAEDLNEIVRLRKEKADQPDAFKLKRFPAGHATAERLAHEREMRDAMQVFQTSRLMTAAR